MTNTNNITVAYESRNSRDKPSAEDYLALIDQRVEFYKDQLKRHPIVPLLKKNAVPRSILVDYAAIQYADSLLWVPMLALLKDRVKNERLKQALRENLLCEAGANATSHVEICRRFIESTGANLDDIDFASISGGQVIRSVAVADLSEPQIAGWILTAETLVPLQFALFLDSFRKIGAVDLTYLIEHVAVDTDEHSQWMRESCLELLKESDCFNEILSGIDIGGRVQLRDPDVLYAKTKRIKPVGALVEHVHSISCSTQCA